MPDVFGPAFVALVAGSALTLAWLNSRRECAPDDPELLLEKIEHASIASPPSLGERVAGGLGEIAGRLLAGISGG